MATSAPPTNKPSVIAQAREWLTHDPWPKHQTLLEGLIDHNASETLAPMFGKPLRFGTAGVRAVLGPGTSAINEITVARLTQALCSVLQGQAQTDANTPKRVTIGYDGRHFSKELALRAAAVLIANGQQVIWLDQCHTPLVAFSVLHHQCAAGIMITASHNPPSDNGYKLYWRDGIQIRAPFDARIESEYDRLGSYWLEPIASYNDWLTQQSVIDAALTTLDTYLQHICNALKTTQKEPASLKLAFSAMHGVGAKPTRALLKALGFAPSIDVAEQAEPNGDFPTLKSPNPETHASLALLISLAQKEQVDIAIAEDPDADRLAVVSRDTHGQYIILHGNEVGLLLADHVLSQQPHPDRCVLACSLVSTPMFEKVVAHRGGIALRTLTGFKSIIADGIAHAHKHQAQLVFGFEEAIGYAVCGAVHDKDGVSALGALCLMASALKNKGATLLDALEGLYQRHGLFFSTQITVAMSEQAQIQKALVTFKQLANKHIATHRVTRCVDYQSIETPAHLRSALVQLDLEGGIRVMLRPSGTEPKLKVYLDLESAYQTNEPCRAQRAHAAQALESIADNLRQLLAKF